MQLSCDRVKRRIVLAGTRAFGFKPFQKSSFVFIVINRRSEARLDVKRSALVTTDKLMASKTSPLNTPIADIGATSFQPLGAQQETLAQDGHVLGHRLDNLDESTPYRWQVGSRRKMTPTGRSHANSLTGSVITVEADAACSTQSRDTIASRSEEATVRSLSVAERD